MQLFGICKSPANPALVFHGSELLRNHPYFTELHLIFLDYTTLGECLRALDAFESVQFRYRMVSDRDI